MNMLVQPAPLPEEMDRGYLGRIMRINGYRTPKDAVEAIAAHFGEEGRTRRDLTTHELLSRMAGMTTENFAQRHTTLPLRRGITSYHHVHRFVQLQLFQTGHMQIAHTHQHV